MGKLVNDDAKIYSHFFKEMAQLRGFTVKYRYILDSTESIHSEIDPNKLSDPIDLCIIYETNPRRKFLRNLGWLSEDPNDKPYIMMLPMDTPNLTVEARIYISPTADREKSKQSITREFKVTEISTQSEYPDCYVCKVVPVFKNEPIKANYKDTNYNYINEE